MMYCDHCGAPSPVLADCGGPDCAGRLCPECIDDTSLCLPCRDEAERHQREQRRRDAEATAELIGILLSGSVIGAERLPRVGR